MVRVKVRLRGLVEMGVGHRLVLGDGRGPSP